MTKLKDGCVKPSKGPIIPPSSGAAQSTTTQVQEVDKVIARVGKEAPDFEAPAFIAGEGFKNITLSEFKGKWIVLCFYPGDFTFV